jgi:hypothetical protein
MLETAHAGPELGLNFLPLAEFKQGPLQTEGAVPSRTDQSRATQATGHSSAFAAYPLESARLQAWLYGLS